MAIIVLIACGSSQGCAPTSLDCARVIKSLTSPHRELTRFSCAEQDAKPPIFH
jgi:hypothetical protein